MSPYRLITINILIAWFSVCLVYYGTVILLPSLLAQNFTMTPKANYITIILVSIIEIFSFKAASVLIDHPRFSRKYTACYGFGINFVASLLLIFYGHSLVPLGILFLVLKFCTSVSFYVPLS